MSIAPPVAFFTSSAKRRQLTVWKLPSGHTVASGSFIAACARTIAGAPRLPAAASTPRPALSAGLRRKRHGCPLSSRPQARFISTR